MSTLLTRRSELGVRERRPRWRWAASRFRGLSRRARINLGLGLLLVVVLVGALVTLFDRGDQGPVGRTATVTRGTVTAAVTGSGNAESSLTTQVNFAATGVVTAVNVAVGDVVTRGDLLATIDDAAARDDLRTAQASLANAEAALAEAQAGPTDVQQRQDDVDVEQARLAVDNAMQALAAAEAQRELDDASTGTAVANAEESLDNDRSSTQLAVDNAEETLASDTRTQDALVAQAEAAERAACVPVADDPATDVDESADSATCTTARQATENAENTRSATLLARRQAVATAESTRDATVDTREQAVTTAEQTRDATLLADDTTIATDRQAVTTAEGTLAAAELTAEANDEPRTPEQIAQSQASVDSALVPVATARRALADTELTAPQDGVVLAVNGEVGVSAGTTTGGDTTGGTGDAAGAGSEAASSAGDGFVVLANASELAVIANIAEADAADLALGQLATLSFPATGTTTTGSVTRISPQSTVVDNVVLYPVTVSLDSAPAGVGVGATAELAITTGEVENALSVPTSAITTSGNSSTVTVRRDGVDTVVPVRLGVSGSTATEITLGLVEGDVVVLSAGGGAGFPGAGG